MRGVPAARLQAIIDNTTAVIYVKDTEGRYETVNRQFERIFHVTRSGLRGRTDYEFLPAATADAVRENDRRVLEAGSAIEFEETVPHDDGPHSYISIKFPLYDSRGKPNAVCGISTDITARKQVEKNLELLSQRLVKVREEEQQRMGLDLHDGVCQELVGAGILVAAARQGLGSAMPDVAATLQRAGDCLAEVVDHLRRMARDLRPMLLHDLGLEESLRALAVGLSRPARRIVLRLPNRMPSLEESLRVGVYRIAQEALTNAVRHARARRTVLTLAVDGDRVRLVVRDDGRGFDPGAARGKALGITGMEQRASALGGRLTLESAPRRGTTVTFECSVRRDADERERLLLPNAREHKVRARQRPRTR